MNTIIKSCVCFFLSLWIVCPSSARENPLLPSAETKIIGSLSTGEPARVKKPTIKTPRKKYHILRTQRQFTQGRMVTLHEVAAPRKRVQEVPRVKSPQKAIALEKQPTTPDEPTQANPMQMIGLEATIYGKGKYKFTELTLHHHEKTYRAWTNVNFHHMEGFSAFRANGREYFFLLSAMTASNDKGKRLTAADAKKAGCPVHRLRKSRPVFVFTGERTPENAEAREIFHDLHTLYRKEKRQLVSAYQLRKKDAAIRLAKRTDAGPPRPKDITIHFWKRDVPKERAEAKAKQRNLSERRAK